MHFCRFSACLSTFATQNCSQCRDPDPEPMASSVKACRRLLGCVPADEYTHGTTEDSRHESLSMQIPGHVATERMRTAVAIGRYGAGCAAILGDVMINWETIIASCAIAALALAPRIRMLILGLPLLTNTASQRPLLALVHGVRQQLPCCLHCSDALYYGSD